MTATRFNVTVPPSEPRTHTFHLVPSFPKIWIGFALAVTVLALELSAGVLSALSGGVLVPVGAGFFIAALVVYLAGLVYWYFWLYRIHKILADTTFSTYPITPQKAVGFRLIPFYNLAYWNFRWTNEIAGFVRKSSPVSAMPKGWVGVWLVVATLLFFFDRGLELIVLFAISAYLTNRIKSALPLGLTTLAAKPSVAESLDLNENLGDQAQIFDRFVTNYAAQPSVASVFDLNKNLRDHLDAAQAEAAGLDSSVLGRFPSQIWNRSTRAGVGAAFGYLTCYGVWLIRFDDEHTPQGFILKIFVVACLLFFFLEPLAEKFSEDSKIVKEHHELEDKQKKHPRLAELFRGIIKFAVFGLIVGLAHVLLDQTLEGKDSFDVVKFGVLFIVLFGGLTCLLLISRHKRNQIKEKKLPAAFGIVVLGILLMAGVGDAVVNLAWRFPEVSRDSYEFLAKTKENPEVLKQNPIHEITSNLSSSTQEIGEDITHPSTLKKVVSTIMGLACAVFVALMGFGAVYKKWKPEFLVIPGVVFAASLISALILGVTSTVEKYQIVTALWAAFWWCLGMLVFDDHKVMHANPGAVSHGGASEHEEAGEHDHIPIAAWIVCFTVFVGLIFLALHFTPLGPKIGAPIVTITAKDVNAPYRGVKLPLPYSAAGLLGEDSVKSVLDGEPSLYAAIDSSPGTYPIVIGAGAAKVNTEKYKIRFVPGTLTIVPAQTKISLASNSASAVANSPVTFTASTTSTDGDGTPSGTVTFYSGSNSLGTQALSNGVASLTVTTLPLGNHVITAAYSGNTNFVRSYSQPLTESIHEPEVRRADPNRLVIPAGKKIWITNLSVIDSNTSTAGEPLIARLYEPIYSSDNRLLAQKGATAILGLSNIDREGRYGARPSMYIHLTQLQLGGQSYKIQAVLTMLGAPQGRAGHIYIPANTILTFQLLSPIKIDSPAPSSSRKPSR